MSRKLERDLQPRLIRVLNNRTGCIEWQAIGVHPEGFSTKRTPLWALMAACVHARKLNQ